jgi:hypothetical protein
MNVRKSSNAEKKRAAQKQMNTLVKVVSNAQQCWRMLEILISCCKLE